MKSRLSADRINELKTLLLSQGIDPKVIDEFFFYSRKAPDFKNVLRHLNRIFFEFDKNLQFAINFEANPSSLNGETGLFYVGRMGFFSVNLILGFDSHSREWYVGDIQSWRKETQKVAFEDNWKRWIAIDFTEEIKSVFSIEINEADNITGIRPLFDFACRKARYTCPNIEPEEDCYCPVEIIVQEIDYTDLGDYIEYKKSESELRLAE